MSDTQYCCPVCTLYLREGITLQVHLDTHPKEQVIEALLKLATAGRTSPIATNRGGATTGQNVVPPQLFPGTRPVQQQAPQYVSPQTQMTTVTYQQFMSSNGTPTFVPQYVQVPTIVAPNGALSLFPTQGIQYIPGNTQYSTTSFNPLYNPYIPHPYPLPQQIQVNNSFPISVATQNYMNAVPGQVSVIANSNLCQQAATSGKNSSSQAQCTIATNTNIEEADTEESSVIVGEPLTKEVREEPANCDNNSEYVDMEINDDNNKDGSTNNNNNVNVEMGNQILMKESDPEDKVVPSVITMLKTSTSCPTEDNKIEDAEDSVNCPNSVSSGKPPFIPPLTPAPSVHYREQSNSASDLVFENEEHEVGAALEDYGDKDLPLTEDLEVSENPEEIEYLDRNGNAFKAEENPCEDSERSKKCEFPINSTLFEDVKSGVEETNHCEEGYPPYYFDEVPLGETFQEQSKYDEHYEGYNELEPATYTDLQPVTSPHLFNDVGLKPETECSNYMEIDGVQIFFPSEEYERVKWDNIASEEIKMENHRKYSDNTTVIQLVTHKESERQDSKCDNSSQEMSPSSLNIQADETMPAKGELSEQESLGADNTNWALAFHGEASYERKQADNGDVSLVSYTTNNRKFKCSLCNLTFSCPKERRVHKNLAHCRKSKVVKADKEKRYKCPQCEEIFPSMKLRRQHVILKKHHLSSDVKNIYNRKTLKKEVMTVEQNSFASTIVRVERNEIKEENIDIKELMDLCRPCTHCSMMFPSYRKLKEHIKLVHNEIKHQCTTCFQYFNNEDDYNAHLKIHPFTCNQCGKIFYKKPNLTLHMKRHLKVKPYECHLCPKSFITRQKLDEHVNGHSGNKPLKCPLCDQCFGRHSNLIQHKNLHHLKVKKKIRDFVCRCGEVFHSRRKLEWHKEVHESKPKTCNFCTQKFIHSASLTRHIRRAHKPEYLPGDNREYENVECLVCHRIYLRTSLMVHMRVHSGDKPFPCKICSKRFSTKWNLELHAWTHQARSSMPYKCNNCKSAFFRHSDYISHMNSHKNLKPFSCNICGQKFIRKYNCLRHQEEHKLPKQFVCTVPDCGKRFHRNYYLKDHLKVHTGARPYSCHVCGKSSSTKSNHNKHVRIHDTREPVNTEN